MDVKKWIKGEVEEEVKRPTVLLIEPPAEVNRECTRISPNAEISGATLILPEEDIEIYGRWLGDGQIICHTLYIEKDAYVEGKIQAQRVRVFGTLKGNVNAALFSAMEGSLVEGTVKCRSMGVQQKARIKANISCDEDEAIGDIPTPVNEAFEGVIRPRFTGNQKR